MRNVAFSRAPEMPEVLSSGAIDFVVHLHRKFEGRRQELLQEREQRQKLIDVGNLPDFEDPVIDPDPNWRCAPIPHDLQDRRVEITGPVDRKMIINALNSGANIFMADFEDSLSPTWDNVLDGQQNLYDAVRKTINFTNDKGKLYQLNDKVATLMVRPRGWHLNEKHMKIDGVEVSASLFDFGLYFYNNAQYLIDTDRGPYFYLPKLESRYEARLWNDVFIEAQNSLKISQGTIKATVLLETILAAFDMDGIIYELRNHMAGLNCGRWDYIFSFIKKFGHHSSMVLPDRNEVGMNRHFLRSYSQLLIKTCHRRGVHAMGGMAAQIPIKNDQLANDAVLEKVRQDKIREVIDGHDGTWVAHPGLIPLAKQVFDEHMPTKNQIYRGLLDLEVSREDLLKVPQGSITEEGLRNNIRVTLEYTSEWLSGSGCVPLNNLMEDAATAEISRAQIWQWCHHSASMNNGEIITEKLCRRIVDEEMDALWKEHGITVGDEHLQKAGEILIQLSFADECEEFLTIPAYATFD